MKPEVKKKEINGDSGKERTSCISTNTQQNDNDNDEDGDNGGDADDKYTCSRGHART